LRDPQNKREPEEIGTTENFPRKMEPQEEILKALLHPSPPLETEDPVKIIESKIPQMGIL